MNERKVLASMSAMHHHFDVDEPGDPVVCR
jgi:hypothetical protein